MTAPVVVILAAGQGTRMRSATPKLLHPLCGWPMIVWPVLAATEAGAGKVVVVDSPEGRLSEVLEAPEAERLAALNGRLEFAVQETPRGTADAVRAAAPHIDPHAPVVVLAGDVPLIRPETLRQLVQAHAHEGAAATMLTAILEDPTGYGRVIRAPDGTVERVVETKAPGDATELELHIREVNTGIFAFDGGALLDALAHVRGDNAQGELYLPDVLPVLREQERTVAAYELADPRETLGINDRVALAEVRALAQQRIHEAHMRAGVTIVDPRLTVIDAGVEIGQDTVIGPFCSLHGATRIGGGATIGPQATLVDTIVGDGAKLLHVYATGAEVGEGVSVGPFAYLRPGTVLRAGAKVGTFVEVKNSDIGEGSKVPHLSYIGDTDIGEGANIGAGTITANYDYKRKNRTRIGDRARISVDTSLVAPVSVGDDAYTAAGSVITKDVPPGALGVARSHQRNVENYARRREDKGAGEGEAAAPLPADSAPAPPAGSEAPTAATSDAPAAATSDAPAAGSSHAPAAGTSDTPATAGSEPPPTADPAAPGGAADGSGAGETGAPK